ncbi:MAG: T9SS type A sorting domain-containing protein, partial [Pigmentiphaga sp.]|nr:T9SS type A sorting domain-containing protein [Pigmentiphaga sp.]
IILPTPTATDATNITKTSFTANWKALTGADEYEVHVAEVSGPVSGAVLANWTFEIQLEKKPSNASQKNIDREISLGGGAEFSASYAAGSGGSGTSAASATKWLDGADTKFWQITVNTVDFTNLTISFKQYSGPAAPKYFKVQYKANEEGDWTDVDGGAVTATDTWATGTVNNLALPAACENIENLFIRWLMISNEAVNGNDVTNNSVNRLDDIVITGNTTPISGSPFTVDGTETSLNIGGLDYETIYYYTVIAKNTFGESAASNEISVVTGPATSTARTELAESSVRVYNNQLMFHAKAGVSVEVYNITGQKVLHAYSQNNGQNILPLQAKGVLIVKIGTETNKIIVR